MILDSEEQQQILLEMIARAHRSPNEVPAVERLRSEVIGAMVMEGEPQPAPVSSATPSEEA